MSQVYFVRIGKHIKIGFTTNMETRMAAFRNAAAHPEILFTFSGDRAAEKRLHRLLRDLRVEREIFRWDHRIQSFIACWHNIGPERAWQYLEETTPKNLELEALEWRASRRRQMLAERRGKRDRIDAICAAARERRKEVRGY